MCFRPIKSLLFSLLGFDTIHIKWYQSHVWLLGLCHSYAPSLRLPHPLVISPITFMFSLIVHSLTLPSFYSLLPNSRLLGTHVNPSLYHVSILLLDAYAL